LETSGYLIDRTSNKEVARNREYSVRIIPFPLNMFADGAGTRCGKTLPGGLLADVFADLN